MSIKSKLVVLISKNNKDLLAIVRVDAEIPDIRIDKIIDNVKYIQGDDWRVDAFVKALGKSVSFIKRYI